MIIVLSFMFACVCDAPGFSILQYLRTFILDPIYHDSCTSILYIYNYKPRFYRKEIPNNSEFKLFHFFQNYGPAIFYLGLLDIVHEFKDAITIF